MPDDPSQVLVDDLIAYLDAAPTPYHAVAESVRRLEAAGFSALDERDAWQLEPGARYFVVKSGGSLIAFVVGTEPPEAAGFRVIGAHTDSPGFRVKPNADREKHGHYQLALECYGGLLYSTWLDRDLSLAGRVSLRNGTARLINFERAVGRIPNLAIHLNRTVNQDGLKLNGQQHLQPSMGLVSKGGRYDFKELLAEELGRTGKKVSAENILGYDVMPYDVQGAAIGGFNGEFLFSARLDNLAACHGAITALIDAGEAGKATRVIALYDHEEIGSRTDSGAQSRFLLSTLGRIASATAADGVHALDRALARSLLVSCDMAHAVHPNYPEKHDPDHMPQINAGPVLKINANRSYGTDAPAQAVFEAAAKKVGFVPQRFVSRNDQPCGNTIGSITAARTGMRTVDVGNPMLSMHSCREMCGTGDVANMIATQTLILKDAPIPDPDR